MPPVQGWQAMVLLLRLPSGPYEPLGHGSPAHDVAARPACHWPEEHSEQGPKLAPAGE
jgi:hypothetical protein